MTLKEATPEQKTQLLAELDGGKWLYNPLAEEPYRFWIDNESTISHMDDFIEWAGIIEIPIAPEFCHYKSYLSSYDAIIPLIQKQSADTDYRFLKELDKMCWWDYTPSQLADALLLASGKVLC